MAQTPGQNVGGGQQDNFGGGFNDAGLTGQNKLVFNYISACSDEQGIHFQTLKNKCRGIQENQLRFVKLKISFTSSFGSMDKNCGMFVFIKFIYFV